ncbi:hypothetical protein EJB05_50940, partial [Eragrostis curvula]
TRATPALTPGGESTALRCFRAACTRLVCHRRVAALFRLRGRSCSGRPPLSLPLLRATHSWDKSSYCSSTPFGLSPLEPLQSERFELEKKRQEFSTIPAAVAIAGIEAL